MRRGPAGDSAQAGEATIPRPVLGAPASGTTQANLASTGYAAPAEPAPAASVPAEPASAGYVPAEPASAGHVPGERSPGGSGWPARGRR